MTVTPTTSSASFGAATVPVAFTLSNDANLTNGAAGMGAYQYILTCWWAVDTGRDVKCTAVYTYVGTSPANYLKSYVQDATFVGNR